MQRDRPDRSMQRDRPGRSRACRGTESGTGEREAERGARHAAGAATPPASSPYLARSRHISPDLAKSPISRVMLDGRVRRGLRAASCATHRAVRRAAGPRAPRAAPRKPSPAPRGRGSPSPAPGRQRNREVQPRCNLRGRSELHCASPGCVAPEHTLHAPCSAARAASTGYGRGTAAGSRGRSRPRSATAAAA